jgi:hypothetical protein
MELHRLPDVGRIQGLTLQDSPLRDPAAMRVELQYTGRESPSEWHALQMPLLDAPYLLNLLQAMSQEQGFEALRRGPGSAG